MSQSIFILDLHTAAEFTEIQKQVYGIAIETIGKRKASKENAATFCTSFAYKASELCPGIKFPLFFSIIFHNFLSNVLLTL